MFIFKIIFFNQILILKDWKHPIVPYLLVPLCLTWSYVQNTFSNVSFTPTKNQKSTQRSNIRKDMNIMKFLD